MAKALAIVSSVSSVVNVLDADVNVIFEVFLFQDGREITETELVYVPVVFDSAAPVTVINKAIVDSVAAFAQANNWLDINKKDVLLPFFSRG